MIDFTKLKTDRDSRRKPEPSPEEHSFTVPDLAEHLDSMLEKYQITDERDVAAVMIAVSKLDPHFYDDL